MNSEFTIAELAKQSIIELSLDENIPWMMNLLGELCEGLTIADFEQGEEIPFIKFIGNLKKGQNDRYGNFALLEGELQIDFLTLCTKTGTVMIDSIHEDVNAVFIDSSLNEKLELADEVSLFVTDKEYELYYHERGKFNIAPVLSEYAHVGRDPYPVFEA